MDRRKAFELEKELKGKNLSGFVVDQLLDNGKSAAVFKANKGREIFAIKVFDNELIERFGHEIQTKRIEQEIALKNHGIESLVKIHEGGVTTLNNQTYYYIIKCRLLKEYFGQYPLNAYLYSIIIWGYLQSINPRIS